MTRSTTAELLDLLVRRGVLTPGDRERIDAAGPVPAGRLEALLAEHGVARHELLHCLSEMHGRPFVEYSERVTGPRELVRRVDPETLSAELWFPLSVRDGSAEVIAWDPGDPAVARAVEEALGVARIEFRVALPSDVVRIVEHNLDVNPGFRPASGRTPLAKARTFLAQRRSVYACVRTSLSRGRTGLAMLRTGLSFVTIALVLHRLFDVGPMTVLEVVLGALGAGMVSEGLRWYVPARRTARQPLAMRPTHATGGTTFLQASAGGDEGPTFTRSAAVPAAAELRARWSTLSPVMRRRFLASDRTDLAEERTVLASLRTRMARARTALSFTRTGVAFVGLGIALLRLPRFQTGPWPLLDAALILSGVAMMLEGVLRYLVDRRAGSEGDDSVRRANESPTVWEAFFPPRHEAPRPVDGAPRPLPVALGHAPGIWGTTGLALERTVLAERRNVMARLRTVMARSRTGLAFVRTGMSLCAVGIGLLAYFGASSAVWTSLYVALVVAGALFVADGLYWHLPAERTRKQFPYCYWHLEIAVPDYGRPARTWTKAVFSDEEV